MFHQLSITQASTEFLFNCYVFSLQIKDIEVLNCEYGKNTIKFLRLHKEGKKHFVKEVEVCTHLRLTSAQEYLDGNNSLVIPTDTMKNIVLVLAKKNGIPTIEQFAIDICKHFMTTFCQVAYVKTYVQEVPWQRLHENGVPHIHSFICVPDGIRFCEAEQCRNGPLVVFAGIKDLKLMKTTQSGFEGFYKNEHTTLPERNDRILCGELFCKWSYGECKDFDFDCIWNKIRECILEAFAGPPDCGEYSPSYQKTVNCIQMCVLSKVSQVQVIETVLNNTFYNVVDMKNLGLTNDKEVLVPVETPYGSCACTLGRKKFLEAQGHMMKDERQSQFGLAAAQGN
ncbi:uricase-like isoform X1 [Rissa tridactyla]|uniref:uricase-like isoform X1 n=1 Tax=Rissa tridactyla TaxID=75485 RepID=UPI0023BA667A|nr:uricase-like isoform X1 [Rissa tridactyla]